MEGAFRPAVHSGLRLQFEVLVLVNGSIFLNADYLDFGEGSSCDGGRYGAIALVRSYRFR